MNVATDTSLHYVVVRLSGTLSLDDQERFEETLHPLVAEPDAKLAIDLGQLDSIDSAGLGSLVNLVTRARMRGGRIVLVAPTRFVRGVLEVTLLDTWFEVCENLEEASRLLE